MLDRDARLKALRSSYTKNLLANLGVALMSVLAGIFLLGSRLYAVSIEWGIALGLAVVLAAVEYIIERALYKKGKNVSYLLAEFLMALMLAFVLLWKLGITDNYTYLFWPLILGFMLARPLIPAVGLLRDLGRLRSGDPCEAVGRMKKNTHRKEASVGRESYLLFEDEMTHEVHLLRAGSLSPQHRYRMLYLPHSGLAVGEAIPDNVAFDPFGNPMKREVTEKAETPAYTEEPTAEAPPSPETEENAYEAPAAPSHGDSTARPDPNSPERQRAARYGIASKVCKVLTYVCFALVFAGAIFSQATDASPLIILFLAPLFVVLLLGSHFKNKELKLRCTIRTTAFCVDTVRRRSGKHSHLHPIVEFEVDGVRRTAELSVHCHRDSVGETYVIYYDPLDPTTVRAA